jgi:hypothetical protein
VPNSQGQLEPDEKEAVIRWLAAHWTIQTCPFHGPTTWEVGDVTATMPFMGKGGGAAGSGAWPGGPAYPLIVVTCQICGYTVFVNAFTVGIVTHRQAPASVQEPAQAPAEPSEQG